MIRHKIGTHGKPIRFRCDLEAHRKGVKGFYRSTDGATLHWITEPS